MANYWANGSSPPFCWHSLMAGIVLAKTVQRSILPVDFYTFPLSFFASHWGQKGSTSTSCFILHVIPWSIKITKKSNFHPSLNTAKVENNWNNCVRRPRAHSNVFLFSSTGGGGAQDNLPGFLLLHWCQPIEGEGISPLAMKSKPHLFPFPPLFSAPTFLPTFRADFLEVLLVAILNN